MEETPKKDWLKRLQNESWEPEILISGIVIYGLFKIFPFVNEFHVWLENYGGSFFSGTADNTVIALIQISISWLIIGFISHLFLRSFWVAFIGLSYVYADKIDYGKLKYHKVYLKKLEKNNRITSNIEKLEKVCSSIFAVSILFFMNVLGLVFLTCVIGISLYLYSEFFPVTSIFGIYLDQVLSIMLLIFLVDYLSSGIIKRIPYVNRLFYYVYKVVGFLLLAPLYRKIYYIFITNHKKWKVFLVLCAFIIPSIFSLFYIRDGSSYNLRLSPTHFGDNVMSPMYYLDEADKVSNVFWLPSQGINSKTLEVFVVHTASYEDKSIIPLCDFNNKVKNDSLDLDIIKHDCLDAFYDLRLDGKQVDSDFFYTRNFKTQQDGLKYFIPIDSLQGGRHSISLYYTFYDKEKDTTYKRLKAKTDFYKENNIP